MDVYAAEEEREYQRKEINCNQLVSKITNKKDWLVPILFSIRAMDCKSFSVIDIVKSLKSQKIDDKNLYHKIWSTLHSNHIFKKTIDKKWKLVNENPENHLETTRPERVRKKRATKTIKKRDSKISCSTPKVSLLLIFAKLLRSRELTKKQIYQEISDQYPFYKPADTGWKKVVKTYLTRFCIKFSSKFNTSYRISEDTYFHIYNNEVVQKEFLV